MQHNAGPVPLMPLCVSGFDYAVWLLILPTLEFKKSSNTTVCPAENITLSTVTSIYCYCRMCCSLMLVFDRLWSHIKGYCYKATHILQVGYSAETQYYNLFNLYHDRLDKLRSLFSVFEMPGRQT